MAILRFRSNAGLRAVVGALYVLGLGFATSAHAADKVDGKECADRAYQRGDHWICRAKDGTVAEGKKSLMLSGGHGDENPTESVTFNAARSATPQQPQSSRTVNDGKTDRKTVTVVTPTRSPTATHEIKSPRDAATGQAVTRKADTAIPPR